MSKPLHPSQAIRNIQHFGEEGGVVPVIDHSATSTFLNPNDMQKVFTGEISGCYLYSRHTNPSNNSFSEKIAAMEGTEMALGTASGMSAIYTTVCQLLLDGGNIISSNTIYGGTYALFANILSKRNIKTNFVDPTNLEEIEKLAKNLSNQKCIIYIETMSNPMLRIPNIKEVSKIAKKYGITLVVDNTFTPLIVSPKTLGADIIVYSCTKYISGSSDLIAGAICASSEFISSLIDVNTGMCMLSGPVMDSNIAYKLYERMDHLALRMKAHSQAALSLALFLKEKDIGGITYPGLEDHPEYNLFNKIRNQPYGHGGMITFDCHSQKNAILLAQKLQERKFGLFAVSLGFSRTLMSCPAASTSSEIPEEDRLRIGLKDGLLRLSIGCCGDTDYLNQIFLKCYKEIF